jgi:hypothetical protein
MTGLLVMMMLWRQMRSEGTIGEPAHLLTDAAVAAIESGEEAVTQRTLLMAPRTPADRAAPAVRAGTGMNAARVTDLCTT